MLQNQYIFRGRRIQRGRGLGSIFGNLLRTSIPILKSIGKYAFRQLLTAGQDTLNDIDSGIDVKQAFRRTSNRTKDRIIHDIKKKMTGGGKKRKRMSQSVPRSKRRKIAKVKTKKSKKTKRRRNRKKKSSSSIV